MPRTSNLTNTDAETIRQEWAGRPTVKKLALRYGVSISVIQNILRGQQYRHEGGKERLKTNNDFTTFHVERGEECTQSPF